MLFKFVRKAVEAVQNQIMGQLRSVQDEVQGPINSLVGVIVGGAWIGDDADAMTNEITTKVVPMVQDLIAAIGGISSGVTQASDLISATDAKASGVVDDLVSTFSGIF
jgi:hypothetical protein